MRSSRSGADPRESDPLWPGPAGFAHRGLHYGAGFPENSLLAFAAALELGAGIECDLRLSADDRILVFHDADAWRLCSSPLVIGRSTLEELSRLRVGEGPIPTLESLLHLVAGRVPLLLEVKVDRDVWRWVRALRQALAGYPGRLGIMSFALLLGFQSAGAGEKDKSLFDRNRDALDRAERRNFDPPAKPDIRHFTSKEDRLDEAARGEARPAPAPKQSPRR